MRFLFTLLAGIVVAIPARADVPDPLCVSTTLDVTQRLLLIPDLDGSAPHAAGSFTVTLKNYDCVPIGNAIVEVFVGGLAQGRTKLCGAAVTRGTTDANGVAEFNIPGGGCYKGAGALVIRANGVEVRNFSCVVSPDYAGSDDQGIAGRWSLSVTAADFAAFGQAWNGGTGGASCHDYNNNGAMDAADLSVFGQIWLGGARSCSP